MRQNIKKGLTIIAIGICIPLFLLFFVSGYDAGAGFFKNLMNLKIMINIFNKDIGVPYRFILAIGIVIVFIGIRAIDMKER